MGERLYLVSQSFQACSGSYHKFFEEFAKMAKSRGYSPIIICNKTSDEQNNFELLSYAEVYRFPLMKSPIFVGPVQAFVFAYYLRKFLKGQRVSKEIFLANGETALGLFDRTYILRAIDQPPFKILKNMEIAKGEVSFVTRIARFFHYSMFSIIDSIIMLNAKGILFSSIENRQEFLKYYHVKNTVYFIPRIGAEIQEKSRVYNKRSRRILFISNNSERIRKGAVYLEKILPEIFDKYPDVELLHIGALFEWNIPERYKKRILQTGKISWAELQNYYTTVDFMVLASISEGFPAALIEAVTNRTPVVSSDIEGIHEYMEHKKEGYIFKRGNVEELKNGICYFLDNPAKAKKMALNASKRIKNIDSKKYYSQLLDFVRTAQNDQKSRNVNLLS